MPRMTANYDSPWKEIVGEYFPDFLAFFFPKAYAGIDWQQPWQSCDKELNQVARDGELGPRVADKLMKVFLPGGTEQFVLVHIEVQGARDPSFAERMFVYNYRIFDVYRRPVASLAVLTDDTTRWRPQHFSYQLWDCQVRIDFPIVKLRDYNQRWAELEAAANPFATVAMAHLKARETRSDPQARLRWKTQLARRLYSRGFGRSDILKLFRFIDWVMALPAGLEQRFQHEHLQFEEELKMQYVTNIERMAIERGLQQGIQQGIEQGIEKGMEKGLLQGEAALLRRLLRRRFSDLPAWLEERIQAASREEIEAWSERILDAQRLEDVFANP